MGKIVSKQEFHDVIRPALKAEGRTIALCHGVFDLVHPGHIVHFEQAKAMADVLVVSITSEKFVRKGPGRPYFNDEMRMKFLSSIGCIDYVMLSEGYTVDDIIESVEPDFYVKGQEYAAEDDDITQNMRPERELVERHGGQVRFTGGPVFSSTRLINKGLAGLPEDVIGYMEGFRKSYSMDDILRYADRARKLRVLVLGDVIIDRYTYCSVQGLMSKNMAYSARLQKTEDYLGGSVAIARHLASFCDDVTLLSVTGDEPGMAGKFRGEECAGIHCDLVRSHEFPTIVKQRYLTPNEKRSEYVKVFVINNIPQDPKVDGEALGKLKEKLAETIGGYDAVFLCDFGHGLIDGEIIRTVQEKARYLVLNCQTNSSNYGLNNITKYTRADVLTLDQKELRLALPALAGDEDGSLRRLSALLHSKQAWLTRGSAGAWGLSKEEKNECPAFTLTVADTIGAGDAFYAVAGIFSAAGAPLPVGTVMGNIAGALGANIVGNKKSVQRVDALKFASTLLNV